MEKRYIRIGDKEYRVEVNWNATTAFLRVVGRDTLDELSRINDIKPSELTALMAACIGEGERLDGRKDAPTALDLGAVITPADVTEFIRIYVDLSSPKMPVEEDESKKEAREESPAL